jgi:hypothetical protein
LCVSANGTGAPLGAPRHPKPLLGPVVSTSPSTIHFSVVLYLVSVHLCEGVRCAEDGGGGVTQRIGFFSFFFFYLHPSPLPPCRAELLSCGSLHIGDETRASAPPTDSFSSSVSGATPRNPHGLVGRGSKFKTGRDCDSV